MKKFAKEDFEKSAKELGIKDTFTKIEGGGYSFDFGNGYAGICGDDFVKEFDKALKEYFPKQPNQ